MKDAPKELVDRPAGTLPEWPLCTCFQVTESVIEHAIRTQGLTTIEEVSRATHAGCGCHTCWPDLEEILERCRRGDGVCP